MPIQEQNIVFLKSQVMDDVPEGGGAATGLIVPDGQMNNVFEDISDLDRAYGRFNLRKLFLAIRSLDTALYGGSKLIISALPTDPALGYTLFTTNDPFDTRESAAARVEAYLYKGPMWHGALNENHITGMRAMSIIQRPDSELPPIGKTLCLVQDEGLSSQKEQYVRVIKTEAVLTTFTDDKGDYQRWIVRMDLSSALRFDFNGHTVNRNDSYTYAGRTRLRNTTVADATRYYSSQPLAVSAVIGDRKVRAKSIHAQLVPSTRTETPLANQPMNPELTQTLSGGARSVVVPQQAHTLAREVTAENRRLNWIETLAPRPGPGTLSISFRSLGNWYTLTAATNGIISGSDPSFGSGTLDPNTNIATVTLGALPDAGSQILYVWASAVHYAVRAGDVTINTAMTLYYSVAEPIKPGTLSVAWLQNGATKTATADSGGRFSGHGTGYCSHIKGEFRLIVPVPPDANSLLSISYQRVNQLQKTFTGVNAPGGIAVVSLGEAVEPGSIRVQWSTQSTVKADRFIAIGDWIKQADNTWKYQPVTSLKNTADSTTRYDHSSNDDSYGAIIASGSAVNYTTGEMTLPLLPPITQNTWSFEQAIWINQSNSSNHAFVSGIINAWYSPAGAATQVVTVTAPIPDLQVRILPPLLDEAVVPNSVQFSLNGQTYNDYNGTIYRSNDTIIAGTINYLSGIVTLHDYISGSGAILVTSLLTRFGEWTAVRASFRAALAPIVPESLGIIAVTADGVQITGSANALGVISGPEMRGNINYEFGTATVEFGHVDGANWIARAVDPGTIRYNAIAYAYIPLDAAILGIDAVRLPPDGRVPIYRPGDIAVILHTAMTAPTIPELNNTTNRYELNAGRTRLAWARVMDANGATVTADYELDRASGIARFTTLVGLATPLTLQHTIADLRMITDAQINGELTLARTLSHDFPVNTSIIAACLIHGDRRARVSAAWDQASWDGAWKDYIIGSPATATLNLIDFPIAVTNEGCDTDRWLLRWLTPTAVELISEKRGLVWSGTYAPYAGGTPVDIAPINPRTRDSNGQNGTPYLTIPQKANGGGWAAGNVVRINTVGAIADFWIARSIQQSDEPLGTGADGCEVYALGNIDRP